MFALSCCKSLCCARSSGFGFDAECSSIVPIHRECRDKGVVYVQCHKRRFQNRNAEGYREWKKHCIFWTHHANRTRIGAQLFAAINDSISLRNAACVALVTRALSLPAASSMYEMRLSINARADIVRCDM